MKELLNVTGWVIYLFFSLLLLPLLAVLQCLLLLLLVSRFVHFGWTRLQRAISRRHYWPLNFPLWRGMFRMLSRWRMAQ